MSPVHSGGCSLGEPLALLKRWPWRLGSPLFSAKAIFPSCTAWLWKTYQQRGFHPDWPEGNRKEKALSVPWSLLLGHFWQRTFILVLSCSVLSRSPRSDP